MGVRLSSLEGLRRCRVMWSVVEESWVDADGLGVYLLRGFGGVGLGLRDFLGCGIKA